MWLPDDVLDQVIALGKAYLQAHPDQEYGAAHVILSDYNFDVDLIDEALQKDIEPHLVEILQQIRAIVLPYWDEAE